MKIVIRDETFTGKVSQEFYLELETTNISIRELICNRIYEEVSEFNRSLSKPYRGLIEPRAEEMVLNAGPLERERKKIDPEEHIKVALKAFDTNGFLMLVNNKQYTDPEAIVSLQSDTTVSFIKLVPLIGG